MKNLLCSFGAMLLLFNCLSQEAMKPGFDPQEYKTMLELFARQADSSEQKISLPYPRSYQLEYRSQVMGLDNRWDLWLSQEKKIAVISIRGTTAQMDSWLENFYAGMIPATGALRFGEQDVFHYKLAADSNAYVHAGWMIGLSVLAPDIIQKINAYYKKGYRDFIIMGHSQGAAIAYLLRSYLHYLEKDVIPANITYKTYNSAAPKPGNVYYAYDYAFINRGGWEHRVVSSVDWVPQVPLGVQTTEDLVAVNPFAELDKIMSNMGLLPKIYVRSKFKSMTRSLEKAEKKFRKNLGLKVYKVVNKKLQDFEEPEYARSFDYVACGTPVILKADKEYYQNYFEKNVKEFREKDLYLFINHFLVPYYYLLNQLYLNK